MKKTILVIAFGILAAVPNPARANCSRHVCEGSSATKVNWLCDYSFQGATLTIDGGVVGLSLRTNKDPEIDGVLGAGSLYRVIITDNLGTATVIKNHSLLGETLVERLQCRTR